MWLLRDFIKKKLKFLVKYKNFSSQDLEIPSFSLVEVLRQSFSFFLSFMSKITAWFRSFNLFRKIAWYWAFWPLFNVRKGFSWINYLAKTFDSGNPSGRGRVAPLIQHQLAARSMRFWPINLKHFLFPSTFASFQPEAQHWFFSWLLSKPGKGKPQPKLYHVYLDSNIKAYLRQKQQKIK